MSGVYKTRGKKKTAHNCVLWLIKLYPTEMLVKIQILFFMWAETEQLSKWWQMVGATFLTVGEEVYIKAEERG
jgi:hypothetical protein